MKKYGLFPYLSFLVISFLVATLWTVETKEVELTQSYPATVCPASANSGSVVALLPNKNLKVRDIATGKTALKFRKPGSNSPTITANPMLITGNLATTAVIQSKGSSWTGAAICSAGIADSWFVGGSGGVTSQSVLSIVNSGLNEAIVDISAYSEKTGVVTRAITIKSNLQINIRLDSLAPGSEYTVLHLQTRSGRVTSYLFDERKKGLKFYGGDFVNSQSAPKNNLSIAGIITNPGKNGKITHSVRLLAPFDANANVNLQVLGSDGVFTPVGFDSINLKAGVVKELPLNIDLGKTAIGVKITSDQPIVASVYTYVESKASRDFIWSTPSGNLTKVSLNIDGLEPTLTMAGSAIDVNIKWKSASGKSFSKILHASDLINWKVPPNTRLIEITSLPNALPLEGAGFIWRSTAGIAFLPFKTGSTLESSSLPISNIAIIS